MFRMQALIDVGFFDPDYFLYFEEVDLMRRLGVAGWQTYHVPEALVGHAAGAATGIQSHGGVRPRMPAYIYNSWRMYFTKSRGRLAALGIALVMVLAALINVAQGKILRRAPTLPEAFFRDQWGYVIRPLLLSGRSS